MTLKEFKELPVETKVYHLDGEIGVKKTDRKIDFLNEVYFIDKEEDLEDIEKGKYDNILNIYVSPNFVTIEKLKTIKCDYYTVQITNFGYDSISIFSSNNIMKCVRFCKKNKMLQYERWFIVPQNFNKKFNTIDFLETLS